MPKRKVSPLSTHTCEAQGCTAKTKFRRDGTPRKYCDPHTADSRARMKQLFADQAAERQARDEIYRTVVGLAMQAGVEAAEATDSLAVPVSRTLVFQPNRKFSNFLVRDGIGTETPEGVVIHFPPVKGSKEQAQAAYETLKPLTATGEVLEGQRITLR